MTVRDAGRSPDPLDRFRADVVDRLRRLADDLDNATSEPPDYYARLMSTHDALLAITAELVTAIHGPNHG